ncbi:hypothetical protein [Longimycelium tulufanense]|nr:hypothetical protein [Longimycelium tulufanense]
MLIDTGGLLAAGDQLRWPVVGRDRLGHLPGRPLRPPAPSRRLLRQLWAR